MSWTVNSKLSRYRHFLIVGTASLLAFFQNAFEQTVLRAPRRSTPQDTMIHKDKKNSLVDSTKAPHITVLAQQVPSI